MFAATYFVQACPICGRSLQIRLEYMGRTVACQHCHGQFTAVDPALKPVEPVQPVDNLLSRVDELLATSFAQRAVSR
jgi:hypothetical protein